MTDTRSPPAADATAHPQHHERASWRASLAAAPVIALGSIVNLLGSAALAFPAVLSPHLEAMVGTMLVASVIAGIAGIVWARLPGTLMETQEAPAMLLGLMGVAVYASLPEGMDESSRVATVIAAFALCPVDPRHACRQPARGRLVDMRARLEP